MSEWHLTRQRCGGKGWGRGAQESRLQGESGIRSPGRQRCRAPQRDARSAAKCCWFRTLSKALRIPPASKAPPSAGSPTWRSGEVRGLCWSFPGKLECSRNLARAASTRARPQWDGWGAGSVAPRQIGGGRQGGRGGPGEADQGACLGPAHGLDTLSAGSVRLFPGREEMPCPTQRMKRQSESCSRIR